MFCCLLLVAETTIHIGVQNTNKVGAVVQEVRRMLTRLDVYVFNHTNMHEHGAQQKTGTKLCE